MKLKPHLRHPPVVQPASRPAPPHPVHTGHPSPQPGPAAPHRDHHAAEHHDGDAHHGHLRRFHRKHAGSRQTPRGADAAYLDALSAIDGLSSDEEEERRRPMLQASASFGGGGQGASEHDRDEPQPVLQERDGAPESEAGKALAGIVAAYLADSRTPANRADAAVHGGSNLARTFIALRDSQARHGGDAPLNHAVLKLVREFLAAETPPGDLPGTLAGIRDMLVGLTPNGVSAEALRNFHVKLPLVLLNLRRPRTETQRTGARASISALLSRSAL